MGLVSADEILERRSVKYKHVDVLHVKKSSDEEREEIARLTAEWVAKNGAIPVYGVTVRDKEDRVVPAFSINPVEKIGYVPNKKTSTSINRRAKSGHQNILKTKRG